MIFEVLVSLLCIIAVYGVAWCFHQNSFWKRNNVIHIPSFPLIGHFSEALFLRAQVTSVFNRLYHHEAAQGQPFVGVNLFYKPAILVRDPELVKRILIKDFNYFSNRHNGADPRHDPVGANNLFQLKNPKWRQLRSKLTPVFTSGKHSILNFILQSISYVLFQVK